MAEPIRWQDAWWYQQPDGSWVRFNDSNQQWEPVAAQTQPVYAPSAGMSTGAKWAIGLAVAFVGFLIVAVLAAIAIPVFLAEREKGWTAQVESALANAAQVQESRYATNGAYADSADDLDPGLFQRSPSVDLVVVTATADAYCIEGRHDQLPQDVWSIDSVSRTVREGPCM